MSQAGLQLAVCMVQQHQVVPCLRSSRQQLILQVQEEQQAQEVQQQARMVQQGRQQRK
jgi:hypothetical protein